MSGPDAGPDAALLALTSELFTVSNLLAAIDAGELDIDSVGLAAATSRFFTLIVALTATPAATERGRIAKVRVAAIASRLYRSDSPRILALVWWK